MGVSILSPMMNPVPSGPEVLFTQYGVLSRAGYLKEPVFNIPDTISAHYGRH
jgi:hypothetical protein